LKTFNRRHNVTFAVALNSFFTPTKTIKWLPQVSYSYDQVHQFGAFLPDSGLFDSPSRVPDQDSFNQAFNANWQLSEKLGLGYRYNRVFQVNRQPGRERHRRFFRYSAACAGRFLYHRDGVSVISESGCQWMAASNFRRRQRQRLGYMGGCG
jgi:hypothetical protein